MTNPKGYLTGFFFGDGGSYHVGNGHWQDRFHGNINDLARIDEVAAQLGVTLRWRKKSGSESYVATWPAKQRSLLELERYHGLNGYTRSMQRTPPDLDYDSFIEGLWDADGCCLMSCSQSQVAPFKTLRIELANSTLIREVFEYLRSRGLDLSVRYLKKKSSLRVRAKDYQRFRELFKLQPYKQEVLELI